MTASKSSRARNARIGAQAAAKNAAKGGSTVNNGGANRTGGAAAVRAAAESRASVLDRGAALAAFLAAPAWAPIRAFRARLDFEAVIARFASG